MSIEPKREGEGRLAAFLSPKAIKVMVFGTALLVAAAVIWPFVARPGSPTYVDFGQWLSGVVQPIAVFWFVIAFLLQREELKLQRRELGETRAELSRQANAAAGSELIAKRALLLQLKPDMQAALDKIAARIGEDIPDGQGVEFEDIQRLVRHFVKIVSLGQAPRGIPLLAAYFNNRDFLGHVDAYCEIMGRWLTIAAECDQTGRAFVDTVRATPHFAFLKLLQSATIIPKWPIGSEGQRSSDARFLDWERLWQRP